MIVDFHSHVLPAADHGSDSLETSLVQIELARHAGVEILIATPHFYPRREEVDDFLALRKTCADALRGALPADAPRLLIGAEVQLCRGLHHLEALDRLCVEGTRVLLLELPPVRSLRSYEETLSGLIDERKLTVVLAHIDRYDPKMIEPLLENGFLAQLNADPFCSLLSRHRCLRQAQREQVVALGSDIHGTDEGYRNFDRARTLLGEQFKPLMERTCALLGEVLN